MAHTEKHSELSGPCVEVTSLLCLGEKNKRRRRNATSRSKYLDFNSHINLQWVAVLIKGQVTVFAECLHLA